MKKQLIALLIVFGSGILLSSCSGGIFKKDISEGTIEFKSEAVGENKPSAMLVPDKMTVKFKDNYSAAELEAGMGFARMKFISDPVKKEFVSQVNMLDKFTSKLDMKGVETSNYYFPDYTVDYGKETKEIAGYKCKKATLKFKDGSQPVDVWFTNDINIKNPNWSNAYYKIDGVLMEYTLKKYGLELHFTATTVTEGSVDQSVFTVPAGYKTVDNKELEDMFAGFF
ncbi:MAG: hypothetical protein Fur0041_19770 [Bacteroidia bacterium]